MHVSLNRAETHQNFNIWVCGETNKLVRGSGLFVGEAGVAANHHFLTPEDGSQFKWRAGQYQLPVNVRLLGDKTHKQLFSQQLEITSELATQLEQSSVGLHFDWGPDSSRYLPHIDKQPLLPEADKFVEAPGLAHQSSE